MSESSPHQAVYAPRAVRPPLTAEAKRGTVIAGALGFVLLGLGYAMVALPIALALIVAFVSLIVRWVSASASSRNTGFDEFVSGLNLAPWIVPLVLIVVVGVVLMIAAIVLSARVLAAHQVRRPWAVTWAGAGIAIVASWFVSGILGFVTRLAVVGVSWGSPSWGEGVVAVVVVSAVVSLASSAAIGWLSWWWMAYAMRPAVPVAATPIAANA
ncbi:hypothetical protein [Lacisediminihabitans sp.]|jgi:hypothetical protein|uniref:hypothetical protein n=1 Tax=Lacisediminihabitans sp. TaxID=2787631 RepID=UPI002F93BCD7